MKRLPVWLTVVGVLLVLSSCNLTAAQQQAVGEALRTDCRLAAKVAFPDHYGWAEGIMQRESRFQHDAQNPRSSAKGCFQLMHSLHSWRYTAVGCTPQDWGHALCNAKAARHLFDAAGRSPWVL